MKLIKNHPWITSFIVISILCSIIVCIVIGLALIYVVAWIKNMFTDIREIDISKLTDSWIKEVAVNHDSGAAAKLFCSDGTLITRSMSYKDTDIKSYLDYFVHLPGLRVISTQYNVSKLTPNVFINTAYIKWKWNGLYDPIHMRMVFVYNGSCIYKLNAQKMPEMNDQLFQISKMW